ncbi:MAG: DEAD/DEAH box helicase [Planctomycetes bacterium]|nr:DEAD/DEAH box helicase [Planctomycetota bacterium]
MNAPEQIDPRINAFQFSVPELGQLVEIRRRQWIVGDVRGSTFRSSTNGEQHLITLASIDEDSIGEEIQVVWQLEPGARILEKAGLPKITGRDSTKKHDAFLDAVRWGAVTNADRSFLQAPFRSGITIEDYQLDPLVRAVDMARVNLLIADDVGLGKTIEAGLVIQELLVRHRARTVFVVCPASLQVKWQIEMWEKFGLEFRIVDTAYIKQLRRERGIHANPWTSFPRLIASMDWMKSGEGLRLIKDILSPHIMYPRKFDILVVDEAHNVAPAAAARYALESQRTRLIRTLSPHFNHRLFLTATPHNGYQESFTSLLELLDDQRFARTVMPDEKQKRRVMIRRLKSDIVDSNGKPVFPKRKIKSLEVDYPDQERNIHSMLQKYAKSRSESVKGKSYSYCSDFVHSLLKKRLFSSPLAFATTLKKHRESLDGKRAKAKKKAMDERILRKAILKAEEDYANDESAEAARHEAVEIAGSFSVPLEQDQLQMLNELSDWAERSKHKVTSKATALLEWLKSHLKTNGQWNDKRVILFTEYRATLVWLQEILASRDYGGDRLMILHGSIKPDDREKIKAAFQKNPNISPVRILLATDAASEGIDLQNHCNYMIHIEIPWNPNVMEQRNGRIDRHGQKESEVFIWHPVPSGIDFDEIFRSIEIGTSKPLNMSSIEGEAEYLARAIVKLEQMRQDVGSVGPVIARQIEEGMLGKRKNLDTRNAEKKAERARKFVTAERKLEEKIARLHERLMEAKNDFHLTPEHIAQAVHVALELAEKPPLKPVSLPNAPEGTVFEVPVLPGSWGRATAGLEDPYAGIRRPITFDHDVAKDRDDDVVLAHLNHKLVHMCLRLLREELWKLDDVKKLHRVTVKAISDSEIEIPVVVAWSRLVITGGDHHRLHEEITLSGGELKHNSYARIPQIGKLESLVKNAKPIEPDSELFAILKKRFESSEDSIRSAIEARSRDRSKFLENTLDRRKKSEISDLQSVLDELENNVREELDKQPDPQLEFEFTKEERDQVRLDRGALEARLARIPKEKRLETAVLEQRYEGLTDRTFPVAVEFIVPRSMLGEVR